MYFSSTVGVLAAVAATASAQAGTTIKVTVGKGGLVYTPSDIIAEVGTNIEFDFYPKVNCFALPCFSIPSPMSTLTLPLPLSEPFRHPILLQRSLPPSRERILLHLHPDRQLPIRHLVHHNRQRYKTHLALLRPGQPLPIRHGSIHQRPDHRKHLRGLQAPRSERYSLHLSSRRRRHRRYPQDRRCGYELGFGVGIWWSDSLEHDIDYEGCPSDSHSYHHGDGHARWQHLCDDLPQHVRYYLHDCCAGNYCCYHWCE